MEIEISGIGNNMGCCESIATEQQKHAMVKELKICIQSNNISQLGSLCRSFAKGSLRGYTVNTFRFRCLQGKYLNMSAYCIFLNNLRMFKYLNTTFKLDFKIMEKILKENDSSGLSEICSNNDVEFLDYYLPIYLSLDFECDSVNSNFTLDLQDRDNSKCKAIYTPVQIASEKGNIPVLNAIHKYFSNNTPPAILNMNWQDYISGENCALIACRTGNFTLIRFLHAVCKADFKVLNSKNESAIQVLASAAKNKYNAELFSCLKYLVEKVEVNLLHEYEETLLILENTECIVYIEEQLALREIYISKVELEYNNRLINRNSDERPRDVLIDKNSLASPIESNSIQFSSLTDVVSMFNNK